MLSEFIIHTALYSAQNLSPSINLIQFLFRLAAWCIYIYILLLTSLALLFNHHPSAFKN